MLRVSYSDTADGLRWSLCGRLAGLEVDELRALWSYARERSPRARAVVDLRDVTFIDEAGESLLAEMKQAGAELVAAGVENKHVIASLSHEAKRPMRFCLEDLWARCGHSKPNGGDK
jgi:hypothetical protein